MRNNFFKLKKIGKKDKRSGCVQRAGRMVKGRGGAPYILHTYWLRTPGISSLTNFCSISEMRTWVEMRRNGAFVPQVHGLPHLLHICLSVTAAPLYSRRKRTWIIVCVFPLIPFWLSSLSINSREAMASLDCPLARFPHCFRHHRGASQLCLSSLEACPFRRSGAY